MESLRKKTEDDEPLSDHLDNLRVGVCEGVVVISSGKRKHFPFVCSL